MTQEEYVTKVAIDISRRVFYNTSNLGDNREIICDTIEEFFNIKEVIDICPEFNVTVIYVDPLVSQNAGVV